MESEHQNFQLRLRVPTVHSLATLPGIGILLVVAGRGSLMLGECTLS